MILSQDLDQSDRSQESLVMKGAMNERRNCRECQCHRKITKGVISINNFDFAFRQQVVFFQRNTRKKL